MKITRLSTAVVEANFHWTYVRVYSDLDGGVHGTGECFFAPGLPHIVQEFGAVLLGEDFREIERLVEKMRWAASGAGSLGGIVWNAISGLEAALWDLKGKALNLPVYELLGGRFRHRLRLYLDCHADGALECLSPLLQPHPPAWERAGHGPAKLDRAAIIEASARRATTMAGLGYTALKFDLDLPDTRFDSPEGYTLTSRDMDWMIQLVHSVRAAVGGDVDLAFDAHWRYRPNEILQVMRAVEGCRLLWLEDPVPPHDLASLRYLRDHSSTPLATGENLQLRQGFRPLIEGDLADIVAPDLQKAGGLAEARKIAAMADLANKPLAPHMIGSPLALMASCHLSATIPNFLVCEYHAHDVPFAQELVEGGTAAWFQPGWVTLTDRPGFGVELDERVARRHAVPGTRWFDDP